jgi:hypothetical protein
MKKNGPLFRETICTCQTQFQMSRRGRTTVSQFSWNASYCAISLVCLVKQHAGWVMFWTSKTDTKGFLRKASCFPLACWMQQGFRVFQAKIRE